MKISVIKYTGEDTGKKIDLPEEVFNIPPNDHAIYLDVKSILSNRRQGTSKTKERSEVRGSTRKIKKQKGTGSARAGSKKNPLFRGGGRVFGPRPRDYSFKLNKKIKILARKSALAYKTQEKAILVIEKFDFNVPKTNQYITLLNTLSLQDKKSLLVLDESTKNIVLSGRNIQKTKIIMASQINTYDVLHADTLVLVEESVQKIDQLLSVDKIESES